MKITGRIQDETKGFLRRPRPPAPNKNPITWIVVVDGHVARVFEKTELGLESIGEAFPEMETRAEITNKSVGRVTSSASKGIRHKYEPHMNESRQVAIAFASQIASWLDRAVWEDAFDRLVLVAAPQMLGDLRKAMKQPVQTRVIAEVNKDLTKLSEQGLLKELGKIIWF